MWMNVLPVCIFVHHVCAWCLQRSGEGLGLPGSGVRDDGKPPITVDAGNGDLESSECSYSLSSLSDPQNRLFKTTTVTWYWYSHTWEAETGRSQVQGQLGLLVRPYLRRKHTNNNKQINCQVPNLSPTKLNHCLKHSFWRRSPPI